MLQHLELTEDLTETILPLSCRESDEQSSDEYAQCQWTVDATSKDRAVCGASQEGGGGCHGHWKAMMSPARAKL